MQKLPGPAARLVVLAQAIETEGGMLDDAQVRTMEAGLRAARRAQRSDAPDGEDELGPLVAERAGLIVQLATARHAYIGTLANAPPWLRWLRNGAPALTLLMGVLTDRVGDPHRLDLLSPPLLAILAWNLACYAFLLVRALQRKPVPEWPARLFRRLETAHALSRRLRRPGLAVAGTFFARWNAVSAGASGWAWQRTLHLAAAGWAAGVALSLLARGLFVQYRVGWESTWLDAGQVHAVLDVLMAPAVFLLGVETLALGEVARLQVQPGGGHMPDRRWALLYVGLLLGLVVVPRLVLAAWSGWRERRAAATLRIDLGQAYFQQIAARLMPARIRLGIGDAGAQDHVLRRILQAGDPVDGKPVDGEPVPRLLIDTDEGDTLALAPASGNAMAHVLLSAPGPETLFVEAAKERRQIAFKEIDGSWRDDSVLLHAITQVLPDAMQPGMQRLAAAWEARNQRRFEHSMDTLALQLAEAANATQPMESQPLSVTALVMPAQRRRGDEAKRRAQAILLQRIEAAAEVTAGRLAQLHDVDASLLDLQVAAMQPGFLAGHQIDRPQAGLAGAASGAAFGLSVDVVAGGLTLGAAAAIGALVGGSAAFVAAAWKNRELPAGGTVQAGDVMLEALAVAGLLRYATLARLARGHAAVDAATLSAWQHGIGGLVHAQRAELSLLWVAFRESTLTEIALAPVLQRIALQALALTASSGR